MSKTGSVRYDTQEASCSGASHRMELRHLRYFVTVAEELHFGRAAERLNMSQPPLSRQIQELEEELGFALFTRAYHKVALTDAGRTYLTHARLILDQVARAKQDAAGIALGGTGLLRVGHGAHLPDGYVTRVLAQFQQAAPGISIELLEGPTPRVLRALQQKSIDVGLILTPADHAGLVVKPLMREPLVIALPIDHKYATAPLPRLSLLAGENFVSCRKYEDPGYREVVEAICLREGFMPRVLQAVEHKDTALDLVAKGVGIAFMQQSATTERPEGIRYIPFPGCIPHVDSAIAWRADARHDSIALFAETAEREAALLGDPRPLNSWPGKCAPRPGRVRVHATRG
jgi:DNA-binding transcriptional LysR family regulator